MKKWMEMQSYSFYEASARQRAMYLPDPGTFRELLGPQRQITSPHLPLLGEAVAFDDGVVVGVGKIGRRPVFLISQEGRFIGGAVGEVGGAKVVGAFVLALQLYEKIKQKNHRDWELETPAILFSFETGGVRLHEANAGLLAHAEIMEQIQLCRGKVPVLSLIGSKVGCFGGMGFVAAACDLVIMSELGRMGLTGPEVIEEVMGKQEFDASDRALIYRTTGGKHKYIIGDAAFLVEDTIGSFRERIQSILALPYKEIVAHRIIGTPKLLEAQINLAEEIRSLQPKDARDVWRHFGNADPEKLPDLTYEEFMGQVKINDRKAVRHG